MKYQGSKNKIAKDLILIVTETLSDGDYFIDLFCGGCNLIDKVPTNFKRIANDKNEFLIEMWKELQLVGGWVILMNS